jgi:hypothetical protein
MCSRAKYICSHIGVEIASRYIHAGQSTVVSEALVETFIVGQTRKSVYKPLCFASPKIEEEGEERTLDRNRRSFRCSLGPGLDPSEARGVHRIVQWAATVTTWGGSRSR